MLKEHPHLTLPPEETELWRHVALAKFVSLLEERALWFARLDTLGDPYEGFPPKHIFDDLWTIPEGADRAERTRRLEVARHNTRAYSETPRLLYLSCWHAAPVESAAMWRLYSATGDGVAIRTTVGRLGGSLRVPEDLVEGSIHGGLVRYVGFETYRTESFNVLDWGTLKRESFRHEEEFRLLTFSGRQPPGLAIPIDVAAMATEIWVSPTAPEWYCDLVSKLCRRYGLDVPVRQSTLLQHPGYAQARAEGAQQEGAELRRDGEALPGGGHRLPGRDRSA